jgi:hypothetical protein
MWNLATLLLCSTKGHVMWPYAALIAKTAWNAFFGAAAH